MKMNIKRLLQLLELPLYLIVFLVLPINGVHATSITLFTGGDVGEGLDLDGKFLYAVNGIGTDAGLVRDANFLSEGNSPGATVTAQAIFFDWASPNFGSTTNDNNLENVMRDIRWSIFPNKINIDLDDLSEGTDYRLQLLFSERGCCNRSFGVLVEGALIANQFSPEALGGMGVSPINGVVISHDFTARDSQLNIVLDGAFGFPPFRNRSDNNPLISGFTLEQVSNIPEPSTILLLSSGLIILLMCHSRHRKKVRPSDLICTDCIEIKR